MLNKRTATIAVILVCTLFCTAVLAQKITDPRDNKIYKTVKIGEQVWFAENLNYNATSSKCYGEGGQVAGVDALYTLSNAEIQANCQKYGRLYNWNTAMTVCPKGWHLPSKEEWKILVVAVGGASKYLKAISGWDWNYDEKKSGNGDDKYGFSALPGGFGSSNGSFYIVGNTGYWWSASEYSSDIVYGIYMDNYIEYVGYDDGYKDFMYSVRCLQD